ncbi:hypothetical protein JCM3775_000657 [Rhodotorula graminis]
MTLGFDPANFTTPVPDYLLCVRCNNVAVPPRVICAKEHLNCSTCYDDARANHPHASCPACHKHVRKNAPRSAIIERAIRTLECCPYRRIWCRVCAQAVVSKDEDIHIEKHCRMVFVECPRRPCPAGGKMRRHKFAAHEKVCSMEICVVAGCPTRTTKANMPAHEAACMAQVKLVERLKDEVRRLNRNIREREDNEELLSEDDEWVDDEEEYEEEYEDENGEESPEPDYARIGGALQAFRARAIAKYCVMPLAPTCAPAPTSSISRPASSSTAAAAAAPSPKRRRTSLAPVDNTASTSTSASSSSSTTAKRPFKVHVVDLEEGTNEMIEL